MQDACSRLVPDAEMPVEPIPSCSSHDPCLSSMEYIQALKLFTHHEHACAWFMQPNCRQFWHLGLAIPTYQTTNHIEHVDCCERKSAFGKSKLERWSCHKVADWCNEHHLQQSHSHWEVEAICGEKSLHTDHAICTWLEANLNAARSCFRPVHPACRVSALGFCFATS